MQEKSEARAEISIIRTDQEQRVLVGLWLALVYFISVWLVLGSLTSHLFQGKIHSQKVKTNSIYTVSTVIRILAELEELESRIRFQKKQLGLDRKILRESSEQRRLSQEQLITFENEIFQLQFNMSHLIGVRNTQDFKKESQCLPFILSVQKIPSLPFRLQKSLERLSSLCLKKKEMQQHLVNLEQVTIKTKKSLDKLGELSIKLKRKKEVYFKENAQLQSFLTELQYLQKWHFDLFATMPGQLLVLLLTLSMGALGSTIFLTQSYFNPSIQRPLSWYLLRPLLGMVMAITVFVLAKSGQLVISDRAISNKFTESLNPFFISFLSIISGILSEQAYEKILNMGQNIFKTENTSKLRWSFKIKLIMEAQDKKVSDLASYLGVSTRVACEWVDGNSPVPEEKQQVIAAWLGRSIRELFSDLPPSSHL